MAQSLRADITGLRAIAVLAVTFFHISHVLNNETAFLSGGFLGVDIFFVISGYLMTMIIVSRLNTNSFSLLDFYKKRAKRICPALLTVVTVTFLSALVMLRQDSIHESFKEGLAALGFVSNFRFAKDLDYFDGGDFSHFFLHTWSLSVEWQFYIFYPIIVLAISRLFGGRAAGSALLILFIISLIVSIIWTNANTRESYYLLPSRCSELLAGSLAYFYPLTTLLDKCKLDKNFPQFYKIASPKLFEAIGLVVLCTSLIIIDNRNGWPTAWVLLPLAGTWLCIAADNHKSLLRSSFFQKIGIWSYAIYLVHWPILVYAYALGLAYYSFLWLIPILLFGILLHVLVEKRRNYGYKFAIAYFGMAGLFAIIDGSRIYEQFKFSQMSQLEELASGGIINHKTVITGEQPLFILHGDSFSLELVKALIAQDVSFVFNNKDGCYSIGEHFKNTLLGKRGPEHELGCSLLYPKTVKLAQQLDSIPIVIAHNWPAFGNSQHVDSYSNDRPFQLIKNKNIYIEAKDYDSIIRNDIYQLANDFLDRDVFIVGKKQEHSQRTSGHSPNHQLISSSVITFFKLNSPEQTTEQRIQYHINEVIFSAIQDVQLRRSRGEHLANLHYVDPDVYCSNDKCESYINSLMPIYADGTHYSLAGSLKAVTDLLRQISVEHGKGISDYSSLQDIDFQSKQTILEYSPTTGFKFPETH